MKKMTSLMLAFVLIFSLSVSAYAVEPSNSAPVADEFGRVYLSAEETRAYFESQDIVDNQFDENEMIQTTAFGPGYVGIGITEITACPLIWEQETKRLFYIPEVGKTVYYSTLYAGMRLQLTSAEASKMYGTAKALAEKNDTNGYHYYLVGWYVEGVVQLRTISPSTPKYIEYRAAEPNFGQGTDYARTNISQSFISCRIGAACQFPDNASDTEYYSVGGVEGVYWYKAENGNVLGIPFFAGLALNA